ncbi:MAG: hypothetical protein H7228_03860 [Polaromonas sp.]|nr:hypothetical protein [Polaromonas sp.]
MTNYKIKPTLLWFWASALLVMFMLHGTARAQGVAMALDRTGDVDISVGAKTARLNVLDYLPADTEIRLTSGASATLVYLATSQEWQFVGPGRYRLQAGQPIVVQGAAPKARGIPAPSTQAMAKLEPTQRERMALGAIVMRSMAPLRIVGPNNVDVFNQRPTLLWQITEKRAARVSIFSVTSTTPVAQTVTSAMQWTSPADLPPGDYTWRAEIESDTPGAGRNGRFRIIDGADPRRARIASMPEGFAQRVAYAVTLESEDLPHDALVLWRALAAERPDEESLQQWAR